MIVRFMLSLLMRVLSMALRLGEKVITGIAKGTLIDPDVRKGEVLVHPEVVPPVGPTTKTITITSSSDEILHGTIELEEKHVTRVNGTTYQYWEITEKNLVGTGYVYLRFEENCILRRRFSPTSSIDVLVGTTMYANDKDLEIGTEIVPSSGSAVVFKAETFSASKDYSVAGWHNGVTVGDDKQTITFAAGLVGAFVSTTTAIQVTGHGKITYTLPNYYSNASIPIYMYWDISGNVRISYQNITTGYHRLVAVAHTGEDGLITSLQDMREVCTYDVSYTYDTSTAARWNLGGQYLYQKISDTRYAKWLTYTNMALNPTYTNEVVPAVLKSIPAKVNVPVRNMQNAFGSGEWSLWQAPIRGLLQEAFGGTASDAEWNEVGIAPDYRVLSYGVSNGKVYTTNSEISSGTELSGVGIVKDTSVTYSKGLSFEGTVGHVTIQRPASISPSVSWKNNITWEMGKEVGRISITPFPATQGSITGIIYLDMIVGYVDI